MKCICNKCHKRFNALKGTTLCDECKKKEYEKLHKQKQIQEQNKTPKVYAAAQKKNRAKKEIPIMGEIIPDEKWENRIRYYKGRKIK
jgi:hypothetical protein